MSSQRAFVIGMGEVGRRIATALQVAGWSIAPITRDAGWDALPGEPSAPRLVCVREEALPAVLDRLRATSPAALVFVQNGWVRPLLDRHPGHTRALVWFTSKGEFFRELRPSLLGGPSAGALATALSAGGIEADALDEHAFRAAEAEKMGFNCVVGLPLAVRGVSLGEYLREWHDEARAVFTEAVEACAAALGVAAEPRWWNDFIRAAEPIGWVRASAAKALDLRNGAVVRLAETHGLAAPANRRLLALAGAAR